MVKMKRDSYLKERTEFKLAKTLLNLEKNRLSLKKKILIPEWSTTLRSEIALF